MHQNDQCKINLLEKYNVSFTFEINSDRLKGSDESKGDRELSRKINRTYQIKLRET